MLHSFVALCIATLYMQRYNVTLRIASINFIMLIMLLLIPKGVHTLTC